ncbi:SseB family protein [Embleya scabrispora]|uniref:SseB family protein n=1 Tax=Embleya scabrispora TaxID=159449 RepID=UPI000D1C92B5|nr:SseB family protein [Embleya scabrispora]
MTEPDPGDISPLVREIGRLLAGEGDPPALLSALLAARLYCERPERVGFAAIGPPGGGVVPVFTSEEQLALFVRGGCDWFATEGADLLRLLPPGYDIAVDLAGPRPVRLRASLWNAEAADG